MKEETNGTIKGQENANNPKLVLKNGMKLYTHQIGPEESHGQMKWNLMLS